MKEIVCKTEINWFVYLSRLNFRAIQLSDPYRFHSKIAQFLSDGPMVHLTPWPAVDEWLISF